MVLDFLEYHGLVLDAWILPIALEYSGAQHDVMAVRGPWDQQHMQTSPPAESLAPVNYVAFLSLLGKWGY